MPAHLPRQPLLALLLATLALLAVSPIGASAAGARYSATAAVVVQEDFTLQQSGYPDECKSWTQATGSSRGRNVSKGRFLFAGGDGFAAGGLSTTAEHSMTVTRDIDYRIHTAPDTSQCQPCGPQSEYGQCSNAAPPDEKGSADCSPAPDRENGRILISFVEKGALLVEPAMPLQAIMDACPKPPKQVPYGTRIRPLKRTFPGAAAAIQRLRPGQEKKFAKKERIGRTCRKVKPKPVATLCTTHEMVVRIRRLKDGE